MLSLLILTGCRTRIIANPERADTVLPPPGRPQVEVPAAPEDPTPPPEAEPQERSEVEPAASPPPPPEEPPVEEEPTGEPSEATKPQTADSLSQSGAALFREETAFDVTVTYDPNGGDTAVVRTVVRTGGTYGAQPEAVRRGYAFAGWWTAPSGGDQVLSETEVARAEAHTLYAHWQDKRTCTVTFDGNGGRVKSKQARLELSDGDAFGEMPTPLREGYDFTGWFTAPEDGEQVLEEQIFTGTDDRTLYAHWTYNPYEFWSFTLQNKTQQIYLCQQASVYFELEQDNLTQQSCALITGTGSLNIAENRAQAVTTDDWVLGKKPQVVVKCVGNLAGAAPVRQSVAERFPEQEVVLVSGSALGGDPAAALYAKLALAKHLYGDWYTDVDLALVAEELGVSEIPILF